VGGRDKPGTTTCHGCVRPDVGPGTEAGTKSQLIDERWQRRGSRGARALWRIRGILPTGQLGYNLKKKLDLALPI